MDVNSNDCRRKPIVWKFHLIKLDASHAWSQWLSEQDRDREMEMETTNKVQSKSLSNKSMRLKERQQAVTHPHIHTHGQLTEDLEENKN